MLTFKSQRSRYVWEVGLEVKEGLSERTAMPSCAGGGGFFQGWISSFWECCLGTNHSGVL